MTVATGAFLVAALMILGAGQAVTAAGLPTGSSATQPMRGEPLEVGDTAIVRADGDCLRLRIVPGVTGAKITCMPEGSAVTVIGGPVSVDGFTWVMVRTSAGLEGWAANEYLELVTGPLPQPSPTAEPSATPVASSSGAGLSLPAPAGSVWSIVAGYNTATHVGTDPWAIDIVREDAPTPGTQVLSPVVGQVSYVSSDCLTIDMNDGHLLLLCHLFPTTGLERGTPVGVGSVLGEVAPPGYANNNGLSHIHLAVHEDVNYFGDAVPLIGEYAIEGRDLSPTSTFNAYQGTTFVSTNGAPSSAPPVVVTPTPTASPTPSPTPPPAQQPVANTAPPAVPGTFSPALPSSGTALAMWSGGSLASLVVEADGAASIFVTINGQLVGYIPGAPSFVNKNFLAAYPSSTIPSGTIVLLTLQ